MRLSTAVTVALTALLVTSMLGMAAVSPSAALESEPDRRSLSIQRRRPSPNQVTA